MEVQVSNFFIDNDFVSLNDLGTFLIEHLQDAGLAVHGELKKRRFHLIAGNPYLTLEGLALFRYLIDTISQGWNGSLKANFGPSDTSVVPSSDFYCFALDLSSIQGYTRFSTPPRPQFHFGFYPIRYLPVIGIEDYNCTTMASVLYQITNRVFNQYARRLSYITNVFPGFIIDLIHATTWHYVMIGKKEHSFPQVDHRVHGVVFPLKPG